MNRIRILHIITHLNIGGAQDNTLITVENLDRKRYDVTLLCGPGGEWLGRAGKAGVRIILVNELIRKIRVFVDLLALVKLYRIIKTGRYVIVHTHSSKPGFSGRIAAKLAGVPVVIHTIHGFPFHDFMRPWIRNGFILLERFVSRFADRLVTVSCLNLEKAVRLGLNKREKFVNIYSGICFDRFKGPFNVKKQRRELGARAGEKIVGMVGRLSAQKSPLTFLEAVPLILESGENVRFVLVGDGELRFRAEAYIRNRNLENRVILLGFREDVPQIMAAMDIFVLCSLWEGLGRSLTEALYMAIPVVATAVEGVPELVEHGRTGMLVPPSNPYAIAEAVVYLLGHPAEAERMGKTAKRRVQKMFSAGKMVEALDDLYQNSLKKAHSGLEA